MTTKPPVIWLNVAIFSLSFILAAVYLHRGLVGILASVLWALGLADRLFLFCNLSLLWAITACGHTSFFEAPLASSSVVLLSVAHLRYKIAPFIGLPSPFLSLPQVCRPECKDPIQPKERLLVLSHWLDAASLYNQTVYDDYSNCRDLQKDKIVMWQHRYYDASCRCSWISVCLCYSALSITILSDAINGWRCSSGT